MPLYIIIETEAGLTVAEHDPKNTPEQTATENGGAVVDAEIYKSFEDAYDAMMEMDIEGEDDLQ
jgi:hypothetical protein